MKGLHSSVVWTEGPVFMFGVLSFHQWKLLYSNNTFTTAVEGQTVDTITQRGSQTVSKGD